MQRKITVVSIALAMLLTAACSMNVGGDRLNISGNVSLDKGTYLTEEQNIARNAADIEKLQISDSVGNITIKGTTSGDISIKAIKKVKGVSDEIKREVMENIDIVVEGSGSGLSIHPAAKDGKKEELWDWVEHWYKGAQVSVDFELEVPENIKVYTIDSHVGNVAFGDVAGEIAVVGNKGDINLDSVKLTGSSKLKLDNGTITVDADISQASKLHITNRAGDVALKLPGSAQFDLEAKLTVGNISGNFLSGSRISSGTYKQKINGGGTEVDVTSLVGNVTIDSK